MDTNDKLEILLMEAKQFEYTEAEQRWHEYRQKLMSSLSGESDEIRAVQLQLAYNRWHGIKNSNELLAKGEETASEDGEFFQGDYGDEIFE
jgi:hypothetical protein